jgi:hypothetical protein
MCLGDTAASDLDLGVRGFLGFLGGEIALVDAKSDSSTLRLPSFLLADVEAFFSSIRLERMEAAFEGLVDETVVGASEPLFRGFFDLGPPSSST